MGRLSTTECTYLPTYLDLGLVMPIDGALRGLSVIYLCATQIHMYFP